VLRGWLHLVSFVVTLVAGPLLVTRAHTSGARAALTVYVVSLAALFGVSAAFHRIRWSPVGRRRMRRADHATIFVAIAGTYTAVASQADGAGNVFVNLEDKSTLLKIDAQKLKVLERWPLAPGEEPTGLSMDTKNKRLFVGCHNKLLVVVNAEDGKVVAKQPIGERVDATAFDPETGLIFSSCGDGTVTVVHQDGADKYTLVETVKTKVGSRTMALDRKTHKLFLPSADFKPNPGGRPMRVPKTFAVLVFGK